MAPFDQIRPRQKTSKPAWPQAASPSTMNLHKLDDAFVGSSYLSILKCRFADQQKTMTFGVYPAVSLAKA
jgi:hypothetical protein